MVCARLIPAPASPSPSAGHLSPSGGKISPLQVCQFPEVRRDKIRTKKRDGCCAARIDMIDMLHALCLASACEQCCCVIS